MNGRQFVENLEALGLTRERAAEFLGIGTRQLYRLCRSEAKVGKPLAMLLRIMVKLKITPAAAERLAWRPEANSAPDGPRNPTTPA